MKEQDKTPEGELSRVEKSNLPDKEFNVMTIKMCNKLRRRMDDRSKKLEVF